MNVFVIHRMFRIVHSGKLGKKGFLVLCLNKIEDDYYGIDSQRVTISFPCPSTLPVPGRLYPIILRLFSILPYEESNREKDYYYIGTERDYWETYPVLQTYLPEKILECYGTSHSR